ncbi:hypothetical protein Hanom_Chr03g00184451 [Helianthus anomalus]
MAGVVVEGVYDFVEMVRAFANHRRGDYPRYSEPNITLRRIKFVVYTSAFFFYLYLVLGQFILSYSQIHTQTIDIQNMYVKLSTSDNIVTLLGNFSDKTSFRHTGMHTASLDSATYNMILTARGYPTVRVISTTTPTHSNSNLEDPLLVKFETKQTRLQEAQLKDYQKILDEGHVWVEIMAGFEWRLKLAGFLKIPSAYKGLNYT